MPIKSGANGKLWWGILSSNIGYLEVRSLADFSSNVDDLEAQYATLEKVLDLAMSELSDTDAMVIDLRLNDGGQEAPALEIASRFFDRKRKVYRKKTREGDRFVNRQVISVSPADDAYVKPIYLLTSNATVSAGEYLVLSLKELPYVTHIGENINGIFSDMPLRFLPNGWAFILSNEIITDLQRTSYEVVGIEPDMAATMFDKAYRDQGLDPSLEVVMSMVAT